MKRSMLVAALLIAVATSSVMASWKTESFSSGSDSVSYKVYYKVGEDHFTIMKNNGSFRVYITFQSVGYEEFKKSVMNWKAFAKPGNGDSEAATETMSSIMLTDAQMFNTAGDITFGVYLADKFAKRKAKVSVVVMPQPANNAHSGGSPNVTLTFNNCICSGVRVVYPPRPVDAGGSQLAPAGSVVVNTGATEPNPGVFVGRNYGNIGTIDVMGGQFGACAIRGNCGTLLSQARTCTIKPGGTKQKVLQGGALGGVKITAGGQIGTISARNGLTGAGGGTANNRIVSGYNSVSKLYNSPASIGQIVVKRGWDKPCVVAGSEESGNYASNPPTFYNGGIGLFRVNNKGDGTYTTQTGGAFTSATAPRVTGKMKSSVSGNTIFVQRWGKCDLNDFVK